jgi:hypothetical protein
MPSASSLPSSDPLWGKVFLRRGLCLAAALLALLCLLFQPSADGEARTSNTASAKKGDMALYRDILTRVEQGQAYYPAALTAQRINGYPVRPFVTIRSPYLAEFLAFSGSKALAQAVLFVLAAGVGVLLLPWSVVWPWKVRGNGFEASPSPLPIALAVLAILSGLVPVMAGDAYMMHDLWAGLLLAAGLAVWSQARWPLSLILLLLAGLIRELAFPPMLVMLAFAVGNRRWREAAGWSIGIAIFSADMIRHAVILASLTSASDPVSQGWLGLGGLGFVQTALSWNGLVMLTTPLLTALVLPLALLGLSRGLQNGRAVRQFVVVIGYLCGFMIIGRPDNSYWGFLILPLLGHGLARLMMTFTLSKTRTSGLQPLHNGVGGA